MRLKLVPFNPLWVTTTGASGAFLLDIKAIYRRPQKTRLGDIVTDAAGLVIWDLTGGLPIQHHAKWTARGFQYVTLADRASLVAVSRPELAEQGIAPLRDWQSYVQDRFTEGPWNGALYLQDLAEERAAQIAALTDAIQKYGAEAAEQIEQRSTPGYRIPPAFVTTITEFQADPKTWIDEAPVQTRKKPGRKPKTEAMPA